MISIVKQFNNNKKPKADIHSQHLIFKIVLNAVLKCHEPITEPY